MNISTKGEAMSSNIQPVNQENNNEQHQIAKALHEIFDGCDLRYFQRDGVVWFVAKDVVLAAGGKWDNTNFKKMSREKHSMIFIFKFM